MTTPTRELLIMLSSHMAYMQGQLEGFTQQSDPEDYYWYRESVALRQKVIDALAEGREPASVDGEHSDEEGPSAEEVEELCEEHGFIVEGYESIECLQGLINEAIARWGRPALAQPEPDVAGELTDQELLRCANIATPCYDLKGWEPELRMMRAAITADRARRPASAPAEGELVELVTILRGTARALESHSYPHTAAFITRAAALLRQLSTAHPERLRHCPTHGQQPATWEGDCDKSSTPGDQ